MTLDPIASHPFQPQVLVNSRHFVRPDEVAVRIDALAGSVSARNLAAHFARQRIKGLLAYQGFDAASRGADNVLGCGPQAMTATMPLQFVPPSESAVGGVDIQNGAAFILLDTASEGPFARAELLNDQGRIGRDGTEVWLAWHSRRMRHEGSEEQGSVGVSLMFGERSDFDEPVFFGRCFGDKETLVVQSAWGGAAPPDGERVTAEVSLASQPNVAHVADDREHSWIVRVEFRDGPDRVSAWLDADLGSVDPAQPHASLDVASIEFDRIRIAVNRSDDVWRFSEFAMALDPQAFDQLARVVELQTDQKRRMDPSSARP